MALTIAQIIDLTYKQALRAARGKRHFVSPELETLVKKKRIKVLDLAPTVEKHFVDAQGNFTKKTYEVQEFSIPLVWSKSDEYKNQTESQKINLIRALLTNGWASMDDVLLEKIGDKSAVVSKEYRYYKGEIMELASSPVYFFNMITAFAITD